MNTLEELEAAIQKNVLELEKLAQNPWTQTKHARGEQGSKRLVLIDDTELISDLHVQCSLGTDRPGKSSGFFGDGTWFWWRQRQSCSPLTHASIGR